MIENEPLLPDGGVPLGATLQVGWALTGLLAAIAMTALVFASVVEFSRTEHVAGYLIPSSGVTYVRAPQAGTVLASLVRPGQMVHRGEPIARLSAETIVSGNQSSSEVLKEASRQAEDALVEGSAARDQVLRAQLSDLLSQQTAATQKVASLESRARLQDAQVGLARETLEAAEPAFRNGYIAAVRMRQYRAAVLEAEAGLAAIRDEQQQARARVVQLRLSAERLRGEARTVQAQTAAERARLFERQADPALGGEIVVIAPRGGRVASSNLVGGQWLQAGGVIAAIVPADALMQVELWVPSRSAGFIAPGDVVRIRYDAFPYQHFGEGLGRVVSVATAPIQPEDMPIALGVKEPVYAVRAVIDQQQVVGRGQRRDLVAGMRVSAIVVLERRSLLQWLLEPLLSSAAG